MEILEGERRYFITYGNSYRIAKDRGIDDDKSSMSFESQHGEIIDERDYEMETQLEEELNAEIAREKKSREQRKQRRKNTLSKMKNNIRDYYKSIGVTVNSDIQEHGDQRILDEEEGEGDQAEEHISYDEQDWERNGMRLSQIKGKFPNFQDKHRTQSPQVFDLGETDELGN